jgi:hypothetical protein
VYVRYRVPVPSRRTGYPVKRVRSRYGRYLALQLLNCFHFPPAAVLCRHLVLPPTSDVLTQLHLKYNYTEIHKSAATTTTMVKHNTVFDKQVQI